MKKSTSEKLLNSHSNDYFDHPIRSDLVKTVFKHKKKVLAIDDHEPNLKMLETIFNQYFPDFEVFFAQSGSEGIEIAKRELPDTILLDYLMPQMNGFEVCKILKSDELTRSIPILMISALGDDSKVRTQGFYAGADAFISKPFDIYELLALINVMLRIKSAEDLLRKQNDQQEVIIKTQTKEFQDTEERFLQISSHALEFFWETDTSGKFTYLSKAAEIILGYPVADIIGHKHFFDFSLPKIRQFIKNEFTDVLENQRKIMGDEYLFVHSSGRKIWLTINGFPVFDADNNYIGFRGVCNDNTRRRQAEEDLKKSLEEIRAYQKKLKHLNLELTLAEEKERKRIAEYIHDAIGQTLSLAFLKLSSVHSEILQPDVYEMIQESTELINSAISESRSLTYDLSPPVLYEFGLIAAIQWKLDHLQSMGIKTVFNSNEITLSLDTNVRIIVYRIICELLANIMKHAEAKVIKIEITKSPGEYCISVIDNGIGFKHDNIQGFSNKGGFGLFSTQERLESIQGSMVIESVNRKGTKVSIILPLNEHNDAN